jgi:hypothetical protein
MCNIFLFIIRSQETDNETESASNGSSEDGKNKRHCHGRKSKASSHVSGM